MLTADPCRIDMVLRKKQLLMDNYVIASFIEMNFLTILSVLSALKNQQFMILKRQRKKYLIAKNVIAYFNRDRTT